MNREDELKTEFFKLMGDRPLFYLKFTKEKEWAEAVQNGNLYMSPIVALRDIEKKSGQKGQGDIKEASLYSQDVKVKIITEDGCVIPLESKSVKFEYTDDKFTPIFCVSGITMKDLNVVDFSEESITFTIRFDTDEFERIKKEFGEYVVLLYPQHFEKAIHTTLQEQNLNGFFEPVRYCHPNLDEKHDAFYLGKGSRFLYKDTEFEYQKEYRFVLDAQITEGKYFNVGSLANCSALLITDELLDKRFTLFYDFEK